MAEIQPDQRELQKRAQEVKDRLLRADPSEGMIFELANVRCAIDQLVNATEKLQLQQKSLEIALAARDVIAVCDPVEAFKLPKAVAIEADQLMDPADGFYNLEHDSSGRPFRWTGPARSFRFVLYIDRSEPRLVTTRFLSSVVPEIFSAVQCFVDDMLVKARYELDDERHTIYAALPPRTFNDTSRTTITFVLPETARPSDVNSGSGDTRMLGVAFSNMEVGEGSLRVLAALNSGGAASAKADTVASAGEFAPAPAPAARRRGVRKEGR